MFANILGSKYLAPSLIIEYATEGRIDPAVEVTLIAHDDRISVLVVVDPDQAMSVAVTGHINYLNQVFAFGIVDVDTALAVARRPHLLAVRRQ